MRLSLAFVVGSLTLAATSANAWVIGYCDANLRWRTEISMIGGLSSDGRTAQSTSIPTQHRDAYAQNVATAGSPINSAAPQEAFTATVQQAKSNYEAAANDLAKGSARVSRKESLCRILASFDIENWQGEIHTLSSNSEGKGVVKIVIASRHILKDLG
jgi:hypothetical protein